MLSSCYTDSSVFNDLEVVDEFVKEECTVLEKQVLFSASEDVGYELTEVGVVFECCGTVEGREVDVAVGTIEG